MKINVRCIKEITNNGEFTTIVLDNGDILHTPNNEMEDRNSVYTSISMFHEGDETFIGFDFVR